LILHFASVTNLFILLMELTLALAHHTLRVLQVLVMIHTYHPINDAQSYQLTVRLQSLKNYVDVRSFSLSPHPPLMVYSAIQITIITVALLILGINYVLSYLIKHKLDSHNPSTTYRLSQPCGCALKMDSQANVVFHIDDKIHSNALGSNTVFENCFNRIFNEKFTELLKEYTKALMLYTEALKKDIEWVHESTRNLKTIVEECQTDLNTNFDTRKTILVGRKYGKTKPALNSTRVVILAKGIEKKYRWEEGKGRVKHMLYIPSPLRLVTGSEDGEE